MLISVTYVEGRTKLLSKLHSLYFELHYYYYFIKLADWKAEPKYLSFEGFFQCFHIFKKILKLCTFFKLK